MNEIQSNINQLLIEKPDLKTYVQQNVRDHMQKKPAKFKDINELLEWKISVWEVQYTHDLRIFMKQSYLTLIFRQCLFSIKYY